MSAPETGGRPAPKTSVLMSTYARESAANLEACLASLRDQTMPPDQIVLVLDGPVGSDQEEVIARYRGADDGWDLAILRLGENVGLAKAMNAGLALCAGSYVLRMDSDDVCMPDRVEKQVSYLDAHPDIAVVSSWGEEFFDDGTLSVMKVSGITHEAVVSALRWRNVIVHPTICVRTEALRAVGGYSTRFGMLEDYDLFIRMAQAGHRFHVIPKVLVRVRSGLEQRRRRGGLRYVRHELAFRRELYRSGFVSFRQFLLVSTLYATFRLVSGSLRGRLYGLART